MKTSLNLLPNLAQNFQLLPELFPKSPQKITIWEETLAQELITYLEMREKAENERAKKEKEKELGKIEVQGEAKEWPNRLSFNL